MEGRKKEKTLYWVIILLVIALGVSLYYGVRVSVQKQESYAHGVELQSELNQVMDEYNTVKLENQDLSSQLSEKDSVIMANRKEIEKLIASQADYRKIKRKLELLRAITQEYVVRIDSLVTVNKQLEEENIQMKEEVNRVQERNTQLTVDKQRLEEVASTFKAYDLNAATFRVRGDGKEIATDRAPRITRIGITFILSENKVVKAGKKFIYARISRPDGVVMSVSDDDLYSFEMDGEKYQYTIKEEIDYENQSMPVKMVWDRISDGAAMEGKYDVMLYMDGKEIGRTAFMVRK
ncbi:MAG: hypothetical protein K2O37_02575 [Bacteroidales bacterium]|nr:hypothetical protein [Bacteroidales bacterium]MDE7101659.1 hypothetical protein [Bacteroidales bacterium]MDE7356963.1 hypothetical protein [Bacteroidales bacterium]